MKTLAIDCRMAEMSGIGVYLRNIVPLCMGSLPDIRFRLLGYEGSFPIPENTLWEAVPYSVPIYSIVEQYKVLPLLKGSNVLWLPHYPIPLFSNIPVVATVHDVAHLALRDLYTGIKRAYATALFQGLRHKAQELLFVSEFSRREFLRRVGKPHGTMNVVHNGVESAWLNASLQERGEPPYFLAVGNIKPHKNVRLLCQAFAKIADKCDAKLLFVGESSGFRVGESSVDELAGICPSKIGFTGYISREELIPLMAKAAALVFPSRYEGFGLPLLEGLAAGVPVIASDIRVSREVCKSHVSYFPVDSEEILAEKLLDVLDISPVERRNRAEKGRAWASGFTWEKAADATSEVLRRVLY